MAKKIDELVNIKGAYESLFHIPSSEEVELIKAILTSKPKTKSPWSYNGWMFRPPKVIVTTTATTTITTTPRMFSYAEDIEKPIS